jgi:hypothetical protein
MATKAVGKSGGSKERFLGIRGEMAINNLNKNDSIKIYVNPPLASRAGRSAAKAGRPVFVQNIIKWNENSGTDFKSSPEK